jgi:hypothetical protein
MRWWHSLAAAGALLAALAAALALTVAGLRPTTTERGHPSAAGADDRRPPLRFGSGGGFKVALFADLHYGEDGWTDWGPAQDAGSDRVMAAVLDAEKPGPMTAPASSLRSVLPFSHCTPHAWAPAKRIYFFRLRGVPRRSGDGEQPPDPQREPLLGQGGFCGQRQGDPVGVRVREPRRHAVRVAARVVLP